MSSPAASPAVARTLAQALTLVRRDDLVITSDEGHLNDIAAAISRRLDLDHP